MYQAPEVYYKYAFTLKSKILSLGAVDFYLLNNNATIYSNTISSRKVN